MDRKARTILLNGTGWETRKHPAVGEVFFLDFPLYRTYQAVARRQPSMDNGWEANCDFAFSVVLHQRPSGKFYSWLATRGDSYYSDQDWIVSHYSFDKD